MQVVGDRLVGLNLGQQLMHGARQLLHLVGGHPQIGTDAGSDAADVSGLGGIGALLPPLPSGRHADRLILL